MNSHLPSELIGRLKNGQITSFAVTADYVNKIKSHSNLNALIYDRYEQALIDASRCDESLKVGQTIGTLHGLPITVKECFDLSGTPSTFGITDRKNDIPQTNDIYINALKDEGAVIIGKTNVSQLLAFIECNNPVYGKTVNPINSDFSCGGSSGGEGALVGAGLSPLGLGTDIGGSVRVPAAVNGACSIKPTAKRIKDLTRFSDHYDVLPIKSTCGPISQDAFTLDLALRAMNKAAQSQWDVEPLLDYEDVDISSLNIGYYVDDGIFPVSEPVKKAINQVVAELRASGANIIEFRFPDLDVAESLFYQGMSVGSGKILFDSLGSDEPVAQLKMLHKIAPLSMTSKRFVSYLLKLFGQRHQSRILNFIGKTDLDEVKALDAQIAHYAQNALTSMQNSSIGQLDAVLSPVLPVPAYLNDSFQSMGLGGTYCLVNNVTGFPAGVACIGTSNGLTRENEYSLIDAAERRALWCTKKSARLPLSVQITAQPWREDIVLALIDKLHQPKNRQGLK